MQDMHQIRKNVNGQAPPSAEYESNTKGHGQKTKKDGKRPPQPSYRFTGTAPPSALARWRDKPVWLCWDWIPRDGADKWTKPPHSATTGRMQGDWINASGFLGTFDQALATMRRRGLAGIGISLQHAGLVGVDFDDCISDAASLTPLAARALEFGETYAEVSPSGTGIKFFAQKVDTTIVRGDLGIEVYHHGRFFTVTGNKVDGAPDSIADAPRLIAHLVKLDEETPKPAKNGAASPRNGYSRPSGTDFFGNVNERALQNLDAWVPVLHPAAERHATGAWRVPSKALGRDLEEDLAYHPDGIRDWGEEHGMSAVDAVLRFGNVADPVDAALWLCRQMGVEPTSLGWRNRSQAPPKNADPEDRAIKKRHRICTRAGEQHVATHKAMAILAETGVPIYQRGNKLVRPVRSPGVDSKGNVVESAILMEIDKVHMRTLLSAHIEWFKWDERRKPDANGEKWKCVDAPEDIAKMILASAGQWPFKVISGIVSTPTMRYDGSILSQQGYDELTHLYLESAVPLPHIPEKPSKAEAEAALKLLRDLLGEFPFVDEASQSVAISAMISAVARGMFDVVPAHGAKAPTPGTGKSYLFDIVAAIKLGERCPVISASADSDGETEKRIIGMAMSGQEIIHIDNVNGLLGGDALCQLIERPSCYLRPLGKSDHVKVENRSIIFFNGNNCRVIGDMTRRVLVAGLDARMEKPAEREFKGDPVATVLAQRGKYIAACMTIVRAYLNAGKPKVAKVPMNSFDEWSASVRSAMIWLGCADPCDTIETAREGDPVLQQLAAFCAAAKPVLGSAPTSAKFVGDLVKAAEALDPLGELRHPDLASFMEDFRERGQVSKPRLGKWLDKNIGRVVDGHRVKNQYDRVKKANRWFIEDVSLH